MAREESARIRVVPGDELTRTANALRRIDKKLPTQFRRDLKKAAKPMVKEAKANAKKIPTGGGARGKRRKILRRQIAAGVSVQAAVGKNARMRIITKMPDVSQAIIPRGMDNPAKGFRHPVFGRRDEWVIQKSGATNRWFMDAMQEGRAETEANIKRTLDEAARTVADAGGRIYR